MSPLSFFSPSPPSPSPFFRNKTILLYAGFSLIVFTLFKLLDTGFLSSMIDTFFSLFPFVLILAVSFLSFFKYNAYKKAALNLPHIEGIREKLRIQTLQTIAALLAITFFFYLLASPESFFSVFSSLSAFSSLFSDSQNLFLLITYCLSLLLTGSFLFAIVRYFKTRNTPASAQFQTFKTKLLYASFAAVFSLFLFSLAAFGSSYAPITEYASNAFLSLMGRGNDNQSSLSLSTALSKTLSELKKNVANGNQDLSSTLESAKSDFDQQIARAGVNVTGKLTEELKQKLAADGGVLSGNLIVKGTLDVLNETTMRDILPEKDDLYNIGSSSKGWNELFVNRVNGINGALQIGSASSSHSLNDGNDLLIAGNAEIHGTLFTDGRLVLSQNPTENMEASTKEYVDNQIGTTAFLERVGSTISPKTAGDTWDFEGGNLSNISNLTLTGNLSLGTVTVGLWNGTAIGTGYGGTGITATPTNGQIAIGNGTNYTLATIAGTASQITVANGAGTITLSLPQAIATTSTPTFSALTLTNALTVANGGTGVTSFGGTNRLLYTTSTDTLSSIATGNNQVLTTNGSGVPGWANLSFDSFTQYALLAGRSGGQTLIGGSGSGENLTLQSTANATKGKILFGTSGYDEVNNRLGVGTNTPTAVLQLKAGTATASTAPLKFTSGTNLTTAEAGAMEYDGTQLYFSPSTTRNILAQVSGGTALTIGSIPFVTTSGYLTQNNANLFWDNGNTRLGIGDATPDTILDLLSSGAANTSVTIGNTNAGNYNPVINFELTENTTLFSTGIDDSDADMFKIASGTDISGMNQFTMSSAGTVSIANLTLGSQTFDDDTGFVSWIDMPVINATAGTVEGYSAQIDGTDILTVYATANGSGGLSRTAVGIGTTAPTARLQATIDATAATTSQTATLVENMATNTTTDGINKYGLTITSTGSFTGSGGTATNNYGIYLNTTSGGDNNYQIYDQSGASLTTAGTWTNAPSYRRYKGNYTDTSSYLDKLMTLDVYEWQYKDETIDGQNRYTDDKNRHASPFLDDFYRTFHLGTENGYNIQDLAGVALASVKELNTRFLLATTANTTNLSGITLETVKTASTLQELQSFTNEQLSKAENALNTLEERIANLEEKENAGEDTETNDGSGAITQNRPYEDGFRANDDSPLQEVIKTIQDRLLVLETGNQALLTFYTNLNLGNIPVVLNGTLDLGGVVVTVKSLDAEESVRAADVETGSVKTGSVDTDSLRVTNTDPDAKTLGTATILAGETSVVVRTRAVGEGSQIFVTPKISIKNSLAVTDQKIGESFTVSLPDSANNDTSFSWWILEESTPAPIPNE